MQVACFGFSRLLLALCLALPAGMSSTVHAEEVKKDVPYVPTPEAVVDKMLELAAPKKGEILYDLGCGDGRIVVTAAKKYGVKGTGVDIDPERIAESNQNAKTAGVTEQVTFTTGNLFDMDFKDADVVTLYLLPSVNATLKPKLLDQLRPGARVVSHAFDMGDWKPDQQVTVKPGNETVYFWIIPAKADGDWSITLPGADGKSQSGTLALSQQNQKVTGSATMGGKEVQLKDATLRGDQLTFTMGEDKPMKYTATINGDSMSGKAEDGGKPFTAKRQQRTADAKGNENNNQQNGAGAGGGK